jgi:glucose repression regulatory protein TUP1
MYNAHRGVPPGPAPGGPNRLADLLEQIRQEFEGQANRANEHEHARK